MAHSSSTRFFKRCYLVFFLVMGSLVTSTAQTTYWWNDKVFYEIFVRSFKDKNGDGQGDFKGLIDKLDYLNDGNSATHNDLGVTAIWLMPVQQSPSYHGYDATDYRTIEQDYGTNQDFKDFIAAAHSRGIEVIVDLVMNHTSSQHPWFLNSATSSNNKRDWYRWQSTDPGTTQPFGTGLTWHLKNGSYYYGVFYDGMPDLNYNTAAVKTEMFDVARFWLEDMGVDGFRLDAVRYLKEEGSALEDTPGTIAFWKEFRTSYKGVNEDAFAVGEAWAATDIAKAYAVSDALDYCFEFDLASSIINTTNSGNPAGLKTQMNKVIASYQYLQYGTFLTNHDMFRTMYQLGNDDSKAKLAANLLLTLPGVPYIYYGEEIGMTNKNTSTVDENKRTPMQWNNKSQAGFTAGTPWRVLNPDYTTKNVESQQADVASLWNNYRKLIALRNNQIALRKGDYQAVTSSVSSVFTFLRQYETESVIVVANTGGNDASAVQISLTASDITPGTYQLVELQGGAPVTVTIDNSGGFTAVLVGDIPARNTLIYKLLDADATTVTVNFQVDMNNLITSGDFDPATETVNIVNDFGVTVTALSDTDADGIYTISVSDVAIGSKLNYKYRINDTDDGREEFAGSSFLREYLVMEGTNTVANTYKTETVTGIEDNLLKRSISIYPVPSNKELFIAFSNDFSGTIHYQLTDVLGEERIASSFVTTASAGQYSLSCEGLSPGVYLLNLTYNDVRQAFRIIVQK